MKTAFETLYFLMNEKISLIEVKTEDNEYHWLMISPEDTAAQKLIFESMSVEIIGENKINVRKFKNAELRFDELFGKLVLGDELFILKNCSQGIVPPQIEQMVQNYL